MTQNNIDREWIELILEAKRLGITPQEIRDFFEQNRDGGDAE